MAKNNIQKDDLRFGSFVFPDDAVGNTIYGPYDYATEYVHLYARMYALQVIKRLTADELEFVNDNNHLFFAIKRNAEIAYVNLTQVHMATYLAYADYLGATHTDLIEVLRGISDTFKSWVPTVSMHDSVLAKIKHYGFFIDQAISKRAAKLANRRIGDDFIDTVPETLYIDDIKNLIEQNLAKENPNAHPICHIATFGSVAGTAVDEIVHLYKGVWARDGFPSPNIGNAEKQYFELVITQSIRKVLVQLAGLGAFYKN